MIPDSDILDTIPQEGAERALQVFTMMKPLSSDPKFLSRTIVAMARALLAYAEWQASQSHELRMLMAMSTNKLVDDIREARAKFRNQVQETLSKCSQAADGQDKQQSESSPAAGSLSSFQ